jgi:hypothetical protein
MVSQGEANEKLKHFVMQQHILMHSSQTCFSEKAITPNWHVCTNETCVSFYLIFEMVFVLLLAAVGS